MTAELDSTAKDMIRAMTWLRGLKRNKNEPWTAQLEAIENSYRRCVSLRVVERASVDDGTAKVENRSMTPLWLTTRQTAETLNISEGLVRKRIREGDLHAVREGRGWRIRRAELERYVEEKEVANV